MRQITCDAALRSRGGAHNKNCDRQIHPPWPAQRMSVPVRKHICLSSKLETRPLPRAPPRLLVPPPPELPTLSDHGGPRLLHDALPPAQLQQPQQQQQQQHPELTRPAKAAAAPLPPPPPPRPPVASSSEVVVMVLGGGPGSELRPLTLRRAEPAVPLAGAFRLVDIPISNCINSGLDQIYVLAQFNATSLNRHLSRAYSFVSGGPFNPSHGAGFVECLNATQCPGHVADDAWYLGTADAVRRYLPYLDGDRHAAAEDVLVLSGDQLYEMDYRRFLDAHRASGADVTIATTAADAAHARKWGVLRVDAEFNVEGFEEKPPSASLPGLAANTSRYGLDPVAAAARPFVSSMGVYAFRKPALLRLLADGALPAAADFARDVLPAALNGPWRVGAYAHAGFFDDVGSVGAYYDAHMALARGTLPLQLFDARRPIYTEPRALPPAKVAAGSTLDATLVSEGCRVAGARVAGSVLGPCTYVDEGATIEDSVIFGADSFETPAERAAELAAGEIPLGIGAGAVVRRAIVDRNARIGRGVKLVNAAGVREASGCGCGCCIGDGNGHAGRSVDGHGGSNAALPKGVAIRDGIIIVARDAVLPDGTVV